MPTGWQLKIRILSQVAPIFDPIGYAAAFVVQSKTGLQRLWEEGLDWDTELSEKCLSEWKKFFKAMKKPNNVNLESCLTPSDAVGKPNLCIFVMHQWLIWSMCLPQMGNRSWRKVISEVLNCKITTGSSEAVDCCTSWIASCCPSKQTV